MSGESLVEFHELHVVQLQSRLLQHARRCKDWPQSHSSGVATGVRVISNSPQRRQSEFASFVRFHDQQGRRAVGHLARVPNRHAAPTTIEIRLQLLQRFERLIRSEADILGQRFRIARLRIEGHDFGRETIFLPRCCSKLMTTQRELILLLATNAELTSYLLGGVTHHQAGHRIGESQLDSDLRRQVAQSKRGDGFQLLQHCPRRTELHQLVSETLGIEERNVAHRIDTDCDNAFRSAGSDSIYRLCHTLKPTRTIATHSVSNLRARNPRSQRDHSPDVRRIDRAGDVPADQLIDFRRIHIRAIQQLTHDNPPEILRRNLIEQTPRLHKRRPHTCNNHRIQHDPLAGKWISPVRQPV